MRDANVGAYGTFPAAQDNTVEVRVATSFISSEQARANLREEIPDWNFEELRAALKRNWNDKLGLVLIEGATEDQRTIFYTGLYYALLCPRLMSEHGRYYSAFDDRIHDGLSYTAYSLWDTFRAEHSLLSLIVQSKP